MSYDAPNMNQRPKGQTLPALKRWPSGDRIYMMQFHFFDYGPKPGKGRTRFTMMLEAYLEWKIDLYKPHWKRSVALIEPSDFRALADRAVAEGRLTPAQHSFYMLGYRAMEERARLPDTEWAKLGLFKHRGAGAKYAGQFITVYRNWDGSMACNVTIHSGTLSCERFIHDQHGKLGAGPCKAFGRYDPGKRYEHQMAEAEAYLSGPKAS